MNLIASFANTICVSIVPHHNSIAPQCINNLTHTSNLQHKAERIWSRNESHERGRPPSTTTLLNPKSLDVQSASRPDSINDNKKRSDHGESKDADASPQVTTDSPLLSPLSSPKTQVNKKKRQCHSNETSHGLNNKLNQVKDTLQSTITNYVSATSDNHKARKRKKMSDYQGVSRNTRLCKYTSRCFNVYIGVYTLSTDAAMAYDEAARRLKGSNCRLNFATIFEYEHSRARELERTGLSVDVVGTSSETISKILEKASNICKGINKEYLDQGTGPSAQTSKATGVLIDENFNANPNTLHAADSSPIQSRERKSDNDPSESSAKDTCMNKYPTSNTVIKPCKVLSEEEKNNHSKLIYHSNSATISSNERKRQHQLQYVRNDDDGDTSLAFHASATKQTNTPSKSIFSDIQDSACNAFDETLTQQSKCEDRMMKLTDYQAEGLKYPIGCRVWYNVEQLHCKLHADSNTQEKGRPNRNNETKNKIKRDLRKMEEMLIEKWNLKEEVITADDGNHFSKIDVVVGDASSASDQSFHSGEVISVYMDCISKEMIYRVMLVENNRKSNHNNVLVPESKLFYAANCPVYISGATVSPKEQAGKILLYRTKQASYTVLIIHGDNQFRVEKDVPLHCVRYRRVTKKHPREIPEITTKRTSNNHEEHISRLIVPCKSCDQVIESKATIQNH